MEVTRSEHFKRQVAAELDREGRPSVEQFDQQLAHVAELTFSAFWSDPTIAPTADNESGVRITLITPPRPYMFPPSVFYARQIDDLLQPCRLSGHQAGKMTRRAFHSKVNRDGPSIPRHPTLDRPRTRVFAQFVESPIGSPKVEPPVSVGTVLEFSDAVHAGIS